MKFESVRWLLLPVAAATLLVLVVRGPSVERVGVFAAAGAGWYALSRRKAYSLDRDRPR